MINICLDDASEDEDIEAAIEAALNAEVGELKEDELKDPLKDDKRIDFANVGLSPEDYIKSRIPQETKKSTKQAVKLYETIMGKKATMDGAIFKPILEIPVDELPNMLSSFFLVAKKVNGNVYNASSLGTYFQSLARFIIAGDCTTTPVYSTAAVFSTTTVCSSAAVRSSAAVCSSAAVYSTTAICSVSTKLLLLSNNCNTHSSSYHNIINHFLLLRHHPFNK